MKTPFRLGVLCLIFLNTCDTYAQSALAWQHNGIVLRNGTPLKTRLDTAATGFETDEGLYLSGDIVEAENISTAYIVFIPRSTDKEHYWRQKTWTNQFFLYRGKVHSALYNGDSIYQEGNQWLPASFKLQQNPRVIYTDGDLIACSPRPEQKETSISGSCYSVENNWSTAIDWQHTPPAICRNKLVALVQRSKKWTAQQLDITNGSLLASLPLAKPTEDLCALRFDSH